MLSYFTFFLVVNFMTDPFCNALWWMRYPLRLPLRLMHSMYWHVVSGRCAIMLTLPCTVLILTLSKVGVVIV